MGLSIQQKRDINPKPYIYIYMLPPPTRTPHFDWFTSIFVWREMLEE